MPTNTQTDHIIHTLELARRRRQLNKQINEATASWDELYATALEYRRELERNNLTDTRHQIIEAAKRIARVQWRRHHHGHWERVVLHREVRNKKYMRNEQLLSFREFCESHSNVVFLKDYQRRNNEAVH